MAARKWTAEQKQRQAELIQRWRPWTQSTGATSAEGKRRSAQNADKGGRRPRLRSLAVQINEVLRAYSDSLHQRN